MGPHLPGFVTMVTTARDQLVDADCDVSTGSDVPGYEKERQNKEGSHCSALKNNVFMKLSVVPLHTHTTVY